MPGNIAVEGPASAIGSVLGLAALGVVGLAIYGLYAWPWVAGLALGYVILCCVIGSYGRDNAITVFGFGVLVFSAIAAALLSIPVGLLMITFKLAATIVLALLTIAIVCYGIGGSKLMLLLLLLPAGLVYAVVALHPPPGTIEDGRDSPERTKLIIHVLNEEGNTTGLGGINVYVSWQWEGATASAERGDHVGVTRIGDPLVYRTWTDPTKKFAMITVSEKDREWFGYYADARTEVHNMKKGETREVELRMRFISTRSGQ